MFCKSCGKELRDGAAFCNGCGAAQPKMQPASNPYAQTAAPNAGTVAQGTESGSFSAGKKLPGLFLLITHALVLMALAADEIPFVRVGGFGMYENVGAKHIIEVFGLFGGEEKVFFAIFLSIPIIGILFAILRTVSAKAGISGWNLGINILDFILYPFMTLILIASVTGISFGASKVSIGFFILLLAGPLVLGFSIWAFVARAKRIR